MTDSITIYSNQVFSTPITAQVLLNPLTPGDFPVLVLQHVGTHLADLNCGGLAPQLQTFVTDLTLK